MLYAEEIPNFAISTHNGKSQAWEPPSLPPLVSSTIARPPHIAIRNEMLSVAFKPAQVKINPPVV
jgi:hypothetical protein